VDEGGVTSVTVRKNAMATSIHARSEYAKAGQLGSLSCFRHCGVGECG
jgi:hypothetical protein